MLWHPETHVPSFDADIGFWAVLGHREVQQANRDWETFSAFDGPTIVPFEEERRGVMLVSKDPPEHSRMRRLISAGFTPRMIGLLEERIRARTERVLDDAAALGDLDFVADVAYPLPMHVIADIIGIPEDDRPEVFRLTDALLRSMDPLHDIPAEERLQVEMDIYNCARELNEAKRANPADDVWSLLVTGELDDFELDLFFLILTIAGSETTRNALAQGLMALLAHPDQLEQLREDPTLLPTAAEEILRWSSPVDQFRPHRHPRHRTRWPTTARRRPGRAVLPVGQPRSEGVRRSVPIRHTTVAEPACRLRRWRAPLLPRRQPRPHGDPGDDGRAAAPVREHRDHRRSGLAQFGPRDQRRCGGAVATRASVVAE